MPKGDKLTIKQQRFADYYIETGNITLSYKKAGYKASNNNIANVEGNRTLAKPIVRKYIDEQLEKLQSKRIASADEVLQYLTSVVRGEEVEEVVIIEGVGDGCSSARRMDKAISARDKVKAAELLGKRYALFTDKVQATGEVVVFNGEDKLQD